MSYEYQPAGYWPTGYWPTSYWPGLVVVPPATSDIAYPALVSAYGIRFAYAPINGHAAAIKCTSTIPGRL